MKSILWICAVVVLFFSCTHRAVSVAQRPVIALPDKIAVSQADESKRSLNLTDTLHLVEAIQLTLLQNPQLKIYDLEIRASEAAQVQARLLPNPELTISTDNFSGSGVYRGLRSSETAISFGQLIELGSKRAKRTRIAHLETELAAWNYQLKKHAVYSDVLKAYSTVLAFQDKVKLNAELLNIAHRLSVSIKKRVEAGGISPAESARADVAVKNAEISLLQSNQNLSVARSKLALNWGDKALFAGVAPNNNFGKKLPDLATLLSTLDQAPLMIQQAFLLQQSRAKQALATTMAIPDPQINIGYKRLNESKDNVLTAGVSFELPVFNRNQGEIEKARIRIRQNDWAKQNLENILQMELETTFLKAHALKKEIDVLQSAGIPRAQKAHQIINEGYNRGKFTLIDVLDAQKTYFKSRMQLVEASKKYNIIITEIEQLTGRNIFEIN